LPNNLAAQIKANSAKGINELTVVKSAIVSMSQDNITKDPSKVIPDVLMEKYAIEAMKRSTVSISTECDLRYLSTVEAQRIDFRNEEYKTNSYIRLRLKEGMTTLEHGVIKFFEDVTAKNLLLVFFAILFVAYLLKHTFFSVIPLDNTSALSILLGILEEILKAVDPNLTYLITVLEGSRLLYIGVYIPIVLLHVVFHLSTSMLPLWLAIIIHGCMNFSISTDNFIFALIITLLFLFVTILYLGIKKLSKIFIVSLVICVIMLIALHFWSPTVEWIQSQITQLASLPQSYYLTSVVNFTNQNIYTLSSVALDSVRRYLYYPAQIAISRGLGFANDSCLVIQNQTHMCLESGKIAFGYLSNLTQIGYQTALNITSTTLMPGYLINNQLSNNGTMTP